MPGSGCQSVALMVLPAPAPTLLVVCPSCPFLSRVLRLRPNRRRLVRGFLWLPRRQGRRTCWRRARFSLRQPYDQSESPPPARQADVELVVLTVFDDIANALARGQRVELRGFSVFTARRRGALVGRNPGTGETVPFLHGQPELHGGLDRGRIARQGGP